MFERVNEAIFIVDAREAGFVVAMIIILDFAGFASTTCVSVWAVALGGWRMRL